MGYSGDSTKKVVKIPRNMAKGEAKNNIGRDSGRGDFESCKKNIGLGSRTV